MPNRTSLCSVAQPPLRCPHRPPGSPTCQSQGGVWRLVETGLPDSTQLRPAWPILWYLTTRLQDTCSFELKCHWGILSAYRHLGLTSDFTLVCYKAENIGPWPWRNQSASQQGYLIRTYWPSVQTQKLWEKNKKKEKDGDSDVISICEKSWLCMRNERDGPAFSGFHMRWHTSVSNN